MDFNLSFTEVQIPLILTQLKIPVCICARVHTHTHTHARAQDEGILEASLYVTSVKVSNVCGCNS
jgi:hypothetical protein